MATETGRSPESAQHSAEVTVFLNSHCVLVTYQLWKHHSWCVWSWCVCLEICKVCHYETKLINSTWSGFFPVSIYVGWSGDWMLGGYRYKGFIVCGFSWFVFCVWDWGWRFSGIIGIIHVLYYSTCNLCFEYVFCILSLLCAPDHGAV